MTKTITITTNHDDWEGLYVNGVLFTEGHKLRSEDIFEALGIEYEEITAYSHLENYGSLPDKLEDLEVDK